MNQYSLARLDYSLPKTFRLTGRQQSIYRVDVKTFPTGDDTASNIWEKHIDMVAREYAVNNSKDGLTVEQISPDFPVVFYFANSSLPQLMTAEAQRSVDNNILHLKMTGKVGLEHKMRRLLTIVADGYRTGINQGFDIGAGSLVGDPSVNESALVSLVDDENHCDLTLSTNTASKELNAGPMADIEDEIKAFKVDGIDLNILRQQSLDAAGLSGGEALISVTNTEENFLMLRYTWFYPGEKGDSFKPEILVKFNCPQNLQDYGEKVWSGFIDSLRIREQ